MYSKRRCCCHIQCGLKETAVTHGPKGLFKNDVMGKPDDEGEGVDFGQNFDDVIFEQPLKGTGAGFSASYLSPNVLKTTRLRH